MSPPIYAAERCGSCGHLTGCIGDLSAQPVVLVLADPTAAAEHDLTCTRRHP